MALCVLTLIATSLSVFAQTFTEYAAKFVCGVPGVEAQRDAVKPGNYATAINIHNPNQLARTHPIKFTKHAVLAQQEDITPVAPGSAVGETLQSDFAMEVDCTNISKLLGVPPPSEFEKGYLSAFREVFDGGQLAWGGEVVPPDSPIFHGQIIFLIDGGCASACEDLVGPFKQNHRATLIGETTQGSSGPAYIHDFGNGMFLGIAAKRQYFPDGSEFEGVGIKPDIEVRPTIDDLKHGRDPVLEKALELAAHPPE